MRAQIPSRRHHPLRFALTLVSISILTCGPCAAAEDTAARSFTDVAADRVKGAAQTALNSAQELTSAALDLIGIRYKWGGSTPQTGLDCSGLVRYVFQQVTGVILPRTARDMSQVGEKIAVGELQPGDLVFFNTQRFAFSHVGIYLGDNQFVHAPRRGREVEVATLDSSFWQKRFNGARRMVGVLPELLPRILSEATASPLAFPEVTAPPGRGVPGPAMPGTLMSGAVAAGAVPPEADTGR